MLPRAESPPIRGGVCPDEMAKELLCTLGPSSFNDRTISRLTELGVTLFRLNLSHTKLEELAQLISYVQSRTSVPLCLDTEGAQIRTGVLPMKELQAQEHEVLDVFDEPAPGDSRAMGLYPEGVLRELRPGDIISIDFDSVLTQVVEANRESVTLRVLIGGRIGSNKAVTVRRDVSLPVMTTKDEAAIRIGREMGITRFALSFARRGSDVSVLRRMAGPGAFIISKIECREAVRNLDEIAFASDALLIDRGDLAREEPLERIPALQKDIAARAGQLKKRLYVATNLLESMVTARNPTRAEVSDMYNTLLDGADGLVLAAETAIGRNPIACAIMAVRVIREFEAAQRDGAARETAPSGALIAPHGGTLVRRERLDLTPEELEAYPAVEVDELALFDCAQIACGTFSPLRGFMDRETLEAVLDACRLPDATPWTMPVVLPLGKTAASSLRAGQRATLTDATGRVFAFVDVAEVYQMDLRSVARRWYGTDSTAHPGVARVLARGEWLAAGDVTLVRPVVSAAQNYTLTPEETRHLFVQMGLSRIVAFHTRNVVNRLHEHVQTIALERSGADALYVNPLVGPGNRGDFLPSTVVESYQLTLGRGAAGQPIVFGCASTYPRFSGPREAVFAALCRKNMGCSHFVIGRNHAGVGGFYQHADYRRLFDRVGDLGIEPIFLPTVGYDARGGRYVDATGGRDVSYIGSAEARDAFRGGVSLPEWYMPRSVQDALFAALRSGKPLFQS